MPDPVVPTEDVKVPSEEAPAAPEAPEEIKAEAKEAEVVAEPAPEAPAADPFKGYSESARARLAKFAK